MLPVVAKTYYEIPVYAGLLNLIVVPGMTVVVAGSWFGLLVSIGTISLGRFVMLPVGWMLQGYTWLCERTLELPWNTLVTGEIRGWQSGMWYGGIACTLVLLRTKQEISCGTLYINIPAGSGVKERSCATLYARSL